MSSCIFWFWIWHDDYVVVWTQEPREDIGSDESQGSSVDSDGDSDSTPVTLKREKKSFGNLDPVHTEGPHDESYRDKVSTCLSSLIPSTSLPPSSCSCLSLSYFIGKLYPVHPGRPHDGYIGTGFLPSSTPQSRGLRLLFAPKYQ